MKPLFIPLKAEYYDAFKDGSKTDELRLYGKRWNEKTCPAGRMVILSRGYGKKHRMFGMIWKFKKQDGETFGSTYRRELKAVYVDIDRQFACISIKDLKPAPTAALTSEEAEAAFLKELSKLSNKYGIGIGGCGCGSPFLVKHHKGSSCGGYEVSDDEGKLVWIQERL
jgi:hypothetical protein